MEIEDVNLGDIVKLELKNRDNSLSAAVGYVKKLTVYSIYIDIFDQNFEKKRDFWTNSRETHFNYDNIVRYKVIQKKSISE